MESPMLSTLWLCSYSSNCDSNGLNLLWQFYWIFLSFLSCFPLGSCKVCLTVFFPMIRQNLVFTLPTKFRDFIIYIIHVVKLDTDSYNGWPFFFFCIFSFFVRFTSQNWTHPFHDMLTDTKSFHFLFAEGNNNEK